MSGEPDVGLPEGQRLTRRHPELLLDEVQARAGHPDNQLRHRVLDLQAGVHLHEVRLVRPAAGDDELHGAGAHVADRLGRGDGQRAVPLTLGRRQQR